MAKCPKCGGELFPQANGQWKCATCGTSFNKKAPQPVAPTKPSEAEQRAQYMTQWSDKARPGEQLVMVRASGRGSGKPGDFFKSKKNVVTLIVAGVLVLIALVILLVFFCGLRGIYVNVDDPNDYFSFGVGTFSSPDGDDLIEGKWSRDGDTLKLTMEDELFGEIELPMSFKKVDGFDVVELDGTKYKRVSLIRKEDNISKVDVRFDARGGSFKEGSSSYTLSLGDKLGSMPNVQRTSGNYVFMGWYTAPDGWITGEAEQFSTGMRHWEDVTYYANWRNDTDYTMTVPDILGRGEDAPEITYREGDDLLSVFMKAMGWSSLPEGVTGVVFNTDSDVVDGTTAPPTDVTVTFTGDFLVLGGELRYVAPSLTEFVIPDSVTSITSYAFDDLTALTSLTIGAGLTYVDRSLFSDCTNLEVLDVAPGNPVYHSAGNCLIERESKTLAMGCRASVIPSDGSVTTIGEKAFYGCSGLTSVTIPESVTRISEEAFYNCNGLTSVTIPEGVTEIEDSAFAHCTALVEIIWNAVAVDDFVVYYSDPVERYVSNILKVFSGAGTQGDGITVTFGDSVTRIPGGLFSPPINFHDDGQDRFVVPNIKTVRIGSNVTHIGAYAFASCKNITELVLPDSVTEIEGGAFSECSGLTSFLLPRDVTVIEYDVFSGCSGLSQFEIHGDVTSIGGYAFSGCSGLTSITIPDNVKSVGTDAFANCTGLTEVNWNTNIDEVNRGAFARAGADPAGMVVRFGENVDRVPAYLLYAKSKEDTPKVAGVEFLGEVTSIGDNAFQNCASLTSVTIPDSVTSIGERAFSDCSGLTSIAIPDGVTSLSGGVLSGCSSLESVTLPLVYPVSTRYREYPLGFVFGTSKYDGSVGVEQCYRYGVPTSSTSTSWYVREATYYFPASLRSVVINAGEITEFAFYNCSMLTTIVLPEGCTELDEAFAGCSGLTSITIPESVTDISAHAFKGCSALESITVAEGNPVYHSEGNCLIETESKELIRGCKNSVIPTDGSVERIGYSAFDECTGLTSITIPESVMLIESNAFSRCTGLTSVIFEQPEGWYFTSSSTATSGEDIPTGTLADPALAAEALVSTYNYNYLHRRA